MSRNIQIERGEVGSVMGTDYITDSFIQQSFTEWLPCARNWESDVDQSRCCVRLHRVKSLAWKREK